MSQSLSDIARILEEELKKLGVNIGSPVQIPQNISNGKKQFNITCRVEEDWPKETIIDLAWYIKDFGTTIRFIELLNPSSNVEIYCNCQRGNIVFRYIEDGTIYGVMKRIDVLLDK